MCCAEFGEAGGDAARREERGRGEQPRRLRGERTSAEDLGAPGHGELVLAADWSGHTNFG